MYDLYDVGNRLFKLRKSVGLTQESVSEKINISKYTLSRIENGKSGMSIDLIIDFIELYGCSMDYLLFGLEDDDKKLSMLINKLPLSEKKLAYKICMDVIRNLLEYNCEE